jgi:Cyclic nucleotide-binding domain
MPSGISSAKMSGVTSSWVAFRRIMSQFPAVPRSRYLTFQPGEVIFREGDDPQGEAYLVHEGTVEARRRVDGTDRLLNTLVSSPAWPPARTARKDQEADPGPSHGPSPPMDLLQAHLNFLANHPFRVVFWSSLI